MCFSAAKPVNHAKAALSAWHAAHLLKNYRVVHRINIIPGSLKNRLFDTLVDIRPHERMTEGKVDEPTGELYRVFEAKFKPSSPLATTTNGRRLTLAR